MAPREDQAPRPSDAEESAEPTEQPAARPATVGRNRVNWRVALPSASLAGFLLAVATMGPLTSPVLLMFVAGALAAFLYGRRSHAPISARLGARVGIAGGLFGFVMLAILMGVQLLFARGSMLALLRSAIEDQLARNPNPEAREIIEKLMTPEGFGTMLLIGMAVFLLLVVICSGAGGAVAGWLMGRRQRKQPPPV